MQQDRMFVLSKLFGSKSRVKVLRMFLMNPDQVFSMNEISERSKIKKPDARSEVNLLISIGIVRQVQSIVQVIKQSKKKRIPEKVKKISYQTKKDSHYFEALKQLVVDADLSYCSDLPSRLKSAGKLDLIAVSGVFVQDHERPIDLIVVGNRIDKKVLEKELALLESELGAEIRYALFDTEEFSYRIKMYDRLLRDVFDYSHKILVNKFPMDFLKAVQG